MPEHDPWQTTTGLVEEYHAKVNDAWFEIDLDYNADTVLLKMELVGEDVPDGVRVESYTCGKAKDWDITSNGKALQKVKGKQAFNENSKAGRLVNAALEVFGDELRNRGVPFEAATWVGLEADWQLDRKEFHIDGETRVSQAMLPVGDDRGKADPAVGRQAEAARAADAPAAVGQAAEQPSSNGQHQIASGVKEAILTVARNTGTYDKFIDAVFAKVDEIATDPAIEKYVLDKRGGAWKDAFQGSSR